MKLSIERINEIINVGQTLPDSKFKFTFDKFVKRVQEASKIESEKFAELLEDLRLDHCSVDEKGNVIRNEKDQLCFTPANTKLLTAQARLIQIKELEFVFYGLLECPNGLTRSQRECFSGVLIPESKEVDAFIDIDTTTKEFRVEILGDVSEETKQEIKDKVSLTVAESLKELESLKNLDNELNEIASEIKEIIKE